MDEEQIEEDAVRLVLAGATDCWMVVSVVFWEIRKRL
jgi:hypothetical protein